MDYSNSTVHYYVNDEKGLENLLIWWGSVCKGHHSNFAIEGKPVSTRRGDLAILFRYSDGRKIDLVTGDRIIYLGGGKFDVIQHNHDR